MEAAPLDQTIVHTSFGPVPVWGRFGSPDRPLLLVIRGAFVADNQLHGLAAYIQDWDVALVHLPGVHTPFFRANAVQDFADAFDEVLASLGHGRVMVIGVSLGGVVALALRSAQVQGQLLVDTALRTASLWMLPQPFREGARSDAAIGRWIWDLFGISETEVVDRDYGPILAREGPPVTLLLGSDPLGDPRPLTRMPSLVSNADRALYRASPRVSATVVPDSGHNIPADNLAALLAAISGWLGRQAG